LKDRHDRPRHERGALARRLAGDQASEPANCAASAFLIPAPCDRGALYLVLLPTIGGGTMSLRSLPKIGSETMSLP